MSVRCSSRAIQNPPRMRNHEEPAATCCASVTSTSHPLVEGCDRSHLAKDWCAGRHRQACRGKLITLCTLPDAAACQSTSSRDGSAIVSAAQPNGRPCRPRVYFGCTGAAERGGASNLRTRSLARLLVALRSAGPAEGLDLTVHDRTAARRPARSGCAAVDRQVLPFDRPAYGIRLCKAVTHGIRAFGRNSIASLAGVSKIASRDRRLPVRSEFTVRLRSTETGVRAAQRRPVPARPFTPRQRLPWLETRTGHVHTVYRPWLGTRKVYP